MPSEKTRGARPEDDAAADFVDSHEARDKSRGPAPIDAARATSPNAAYLRPVAPLDPAPPEQQAARPHPDAPAADERATDRGVKPFVRGLPEDPAVGRLRAANPGLRGSVLRVVVIVALVAVALWLVLS